MDAVDCNEALKVRSAYLQQLSIFLAGVRRFVP